MSEREDLERVERKLEEEPLALLTKDVCSSFRGIRKIVMKEAHRLIREEKMPFREAMTRAWAEVKRKCLLEHGVPV